ncbi:hypothetical protein CHS0354_032080 [Potamilus streckersoni]|uniref:Uncharacterized protein n=1 Tax=Potamilus streckersoni TaxID=2493646 RepID=A0AAE0WHM6_9BIVA|nr:hypothetical protein CHS0354_032080 [Potamilus streckersoni]
MTDFCSIIENNEGARGSFSDWSDLRRKYDRIAQLKMERGIKPLPLGLLLKLCGPRKQYDDSLNITTANEEEKMSFVTNFMSMPRKGFVNKANGNFLANKGNIKATAHAMKHKALPLRPAFQRSVTIPGRYFPKPSQIEDQKENFQNRNVSESLRERSRTISTRSTASLLSRSSSRVTKLSDGFAFKRSDTTSSISQNSRRKVTFLNKPVSSENNLDEKVDLYAISFRTDVDEGYDPKSELHSDYYTIKRISPTSRQVTFPSKDTNFFTVLHGRPKFLHGRIYVPLEPEERKTGHRSNVVFLEGPDLSPISTGRNK